MQKIPPEVLSNIFQFFISSDSDSEPNPYSPLILGTICGRWRAITWSTPRLWSSISINFGTGSKLQLAQEWLSRSGQLPLSISMTAGIDRDLLPLLSALIDVINGYAHRWRVLDILLPPPMLPLFHADPRGISILHTLRIDPGILFSEARRVSENFNPTNPCPSPIVVGIFSVHFKSVRIRWGNVTHLDVEYFSIDECFEVLRQAPSLTNCRFDSIKSNQHDFPLPESILYHPNLTSLSICCQDPAIFFQYISFPYLIFLSLGGDFTRFPTQDFLSFLRRSSPPLHELHLLSFEGEDEESIFQILNGTPSLKIFRLYPCMDNEYNPSRLFQRLSDSPSTFSNNGAEFLPHLETMSYRGLLNFPWDLIPKIFGPTWRPLSNFDLDCYGLFQEDPKGSLH